MSKFTLLTPLKMIASSILFLSVSVIRTNHKQEKASINRQAFYCSASYK